MPAFQRQYLTTMSQIYSWHEMHKVVLPLTEKTTTTKRKKKQQQQHI